MKKKIMTLGLVLSMIFGTSTYLSFANNHKDTGYSFYFTTGRNTLRTSPREKQDKSSSYVKVESGKNLSNGVNMSMVGGNYQDVGSSVKTFKRPGSAKIPQYAKEWNINSVRLQGVKVRNNYMTVFGLWSPDSI